MGSAAAREEIMGWSFSITCKSQKALDSMIAFMAKNSPTGRRAPLTGGGIKYGGNPMSLGFNSPAAYEQGLLRWMALRVGKRRIFPGKGIHTAVPWINLDNNGSEPVLLAVEWPNLTGTDQRQYLVDEHGFQEQYMYQDEEESTFTQQLLDIITGRKKQDAIIHAELKHLTELWNLEYPQ